MIIERSLINDEEMYKALYSFIDTDISLSKDPKSAKSKYIRELIPLFSDVSLKEVNKSVIINCLENGEYTTITQRFLIFLCKNYLDQANYLQAILYFEDSFSKIAKNNNIIYFLKSDITHKFIELFPVVDKHVFTMFFCDITDITFVDIILKERISYYINHNVKLAKGTSNSIQARCHEVVYICNNFLAKTPHTNITKESIRDYLSSKSVRLGTMIEINKILLFLCNDGLIANSDIQDICLIKEKMNALTLEKYIELLSSNNIDRYFICKRVKSLRLFYAPITNDEIFMTVKEYAMNSTESSSTFVKFLQDFNASIDGLNITGIDDLSINSFSHQIKYFANYKDRTILTFLVGYYFMIATKYNTEIFIKDGFDTRILQLTGLAHYISDGYELIKFNPIESVPYPDKWLLCYSSANETNSMTSTSNTKLVDFTIIHNKTYRYWFKYYVWKSNNSLYTRLHSIFQVANFFNYIDDLKKGKELSIYATKSNNTDLTLNEIIAWKNHVLNTYDNNRTRSSHIYNPRNILKFVHENGIVELPNGIYYYLTHKLDSNYDNTKSISDAHLKQISRLMSDKAESNILCAVYYLAFYIALETEFRATQLFTLKTDCVIETSKKNEYVLVSKTKTSANEEIEQPITIYVKRHIDEIIKLTKPYRDDNNIGDISDYLFITPGSKKKSYVIISVSMFNKYLQKCCEELELPSYSYQNLRDTHMTKAEEFIIRNQMSDIEQNILSGHRSPNVDSKHYIDTQIKDLLESVHGVIIGDVDVSGKVKESLSSDVATLENSVSNSCGYCGCKNCEDYSFLDCMLCKDFVTTIDRLPYFEEQVKILDEKIKNATIPHDKEDFVNMKRLHLGFINKILEVQSKKGEKSSDI